MQQTQLRLVSPTQTEDSMRQVTAALDAIERERLKRTQKDAFEGRNRKGS